MAQQDKALSLIRRRGWLIALLSVGFLSAFVMLAYTITPVYRAEGRVLIEQGEISSDIVETTVRGFAEERIEIARERVMTADHIHQMIQDYGLYADSSGSLPEMYALFRERTSVVVEELEDGTISFIVAFDDENAVKATEIAARLIELFQEENVKSRTESAVNAAEFLEEEASRLSVEIAEYEIQIADYKEQNSGRLPEQEGLNVQLLDRVERDLEDVEREIRELAQRKAIAEADLMRVRSNAGAVGGAVPSPGSPDRLRYLQAEYLRMLSTYSSEHPDVRKIRREIEILDPTGSLDTSPVIADQIREKTIELAELRNRYSEDHPDVLVTIRTLDRLQRELDSTNIELETTSSADPELVLLLAVISGLDREMAAQRIRRDELRERMALYGSRLMGAPQVQREYLSLTRGYDQLRQKYDDVKLKQTQLELAVSVEEEQRGGRFAVSTRARTPESPFFPNRPALIFLGIFLGIGSGLMLATVLDAMNKTVRDEIDIRDAWEGPPLVSIPLIQNDTDTRKRRSQVTTYVAVMLLMVVAASISVLVS